MPRKSILTNSEKESLIDIPQNEEDLIRYYTFSENDFSFIKQHRGDANRLGFAIHLCYLRYPGQFLSPNQIPHPFILEIAAKQLNISAETWDEYGKREQTRRVHLQELQNIYKYRTFGFDDYQVVLELAIRIALQTDKGILIAIEIIEYLRKNSILLPSINVIERICSEALTKANRQIYTLLSFPLTSSQYKILDKLLKRKENSSITWMMWLKQSPHKVNTKSMLEHIEKLKLLQSIEIPEAIEHSIHQNRLLKIAREGSQMSTSDLAKFESNRRYATLVVICIEATATIIDEIIELHDKIIGKLFNIAKHKHEEKLKSYKYALKSYINEMKTYLELMKVFYKEREGKMHYVFFNIHNTGTIFDEHLDTEIRSNNSLFSESIYSNSSNHPKRPDKPERNISFEQNLFDPMKHIRDIPHVDFSDSNPQILRRYIEIKDNSISLIFRDLKADEDAKLLKRAVFIKSDNLNDLEFEIKSKKSNKRIIKKVKLLFKEKITRDEAIQMFRA